MKKYYSAGGQRIALRSGGTLAWLLSDHLGGTAYTGGGRNLFDAGTPRW